MGHPASPRSPSARDLGHPDSHPFANYAKGWGTQIPTLSQTTRKDGAPSISQVPKCEGPGAPRFPHFRKLRERMGHRASPRSPSARDLGHPDSHPFANYAKGWGTEAFLGRFATREGQAVLPLQFDSVTLQHRSSTVGWKEGCAAFWGVLQQEYSSLPSWTGLSFMQSG